MQLDDLEATLVELERFKAKALEARHVLTTNKYASITGTPETAACNRASMELTRSLALLRNPCRTRAVRNG